MDDSLVSVIVAVYNGENYLSQALESVLKQSFQNIEIIIVDDGSSDNTAELAKSYCDRANVQYIYQANGGHGAALNTGVSSARGEFLSFIDHDDVWDADKLHIQMNAFTDDPSLDVVFSHQKSFADNKAAERLSFAKDPVPGYMPGPMLIRAGSFPKVGLFNTEIRKGYFFQWYDRMNMLGLNKLLLPDLLYHRRVHGQNISIGRDNEDYKDYFSAIRAIRNQRDQ
jgi:glycosyltransferase involved in cell wall biosynthesis